MATLSLAAFLAKWTDNTTGRFKDNTTQDIGADDLREFADDIADSFTLSGGLNWTVIQIGDWDMDTNATKDVAHGLVDYKKIRSLSVIVRDDSDSTYTSLLGDDSTAFGAVQTSGSLNIRCSRVTSGFFDNISFNATSFNRGWITIGYVD